MAFFVLFVFVYVFLILIQMAGKHACKINYNTTFSFYWQCHTVFITKTYHKCCFAFNFAAFSFGTSAIRESPKSLNRNDQSINSLQSMFGWNDKMAEDEAKVNKLLNFQGFQENKTIWYVMNLQSTLCICICCILIKRPLNCNWHHYLSTNERSDQCQKIERLGLL